MNKIPYDEAISLLKNSRYTTVFTGAGISIDSGIPPFRGPGGIWNKYDPGFLDINTFYQDPQKSWAMIKEIFYNFLTNAEPNEAHEVLAYWEREDKIKTVITQNIDGLHQAAGCTNVIEFHGTLSLLRGIESKKTYPVEKSYINMPLPRGKKNEILKPDIVFYGEGISEEVLSRSVKEARRSEVMIVIGSTGEVYPAAAIPEEAKRNGATIIEINPDPSKFTDGITDIYLPVGASEGLKNLREQI